MTHGEESDVLRHKMMTLHTGRISVCFLLFTDFNTNFIEMQIPKYMNHKAYIFSLEWGIPGTI